MFVAEIVVSHSPSLYAPAYTPVGADVRNEKVYVSTLVISFGSSVKENDSYIERKGAVPHMENTSLPIVQQAFLHMYHTAIKNQTITN